VGQINDKEEVKNINVDILQSYKLINSFLVVLTVACVVIRFLGSIFIFILAKKFDKINKSI
jgi:hypothetical protein